MPTSPIPTSDPPLLPWLENFSTNLPAHAAALPLDAAVVTAAQDDCAYLAFCISPLVVARRNDADQAVAYKDIIKNGPVGTPAGAIPTVAP